MIPTTLPRCSARARQLESGQTRQSFGAWCRWKRRSTGGRSGTSRGGPSSSTKCTQVRCACENFSWQCHRRGGTAASGGCALAHTPCTNAGRPCLLDCSCQCVITCHASLCRSNYMHPPQGQAVAVQSMAMHPHRAYRLRLEQVQPGALRCRQPPAKGGARLQVQHLLP